MPPSERMESAILGRSDEIAFVIWRMLLQCRVQLGLNLFRNDPCRVNVPIQLASRAFDLRPDGHERAIGQLGQTGIAGGPAADFLGAIGEQGRFAPGLPFIA